jgi:hypothetical protein
MLDSFLKIKSHGLQGGVDSIESEAAPKFIIRNTVVTGILAHTHTHIGRISWDMTGRAGRYPWSTWQGRPAEKQQETGTPKSWTSAPTLSPPATLLFVYVQRKLRRVCVVVWLCS